MPPGDITPVIEGPTSSESEVEPADQLPQMVTTDPFASIREPEERRKGQGQDVSEASPSATTVTLQQAPSAKTVSTAASRALSEFDRQLDKSCGLASNSDKEPEEPLFKRRFNLIMGAVIFCNLLTFAIEVDNHDGSNAATVAWALLDSVYIVIYISEIVIRIHWEGREAWPRSPWNWFDVAVVTCAVLDIWVLSWVQKSNVKLLAVLRIVRIVRLVRTIKLLRSFPGLYVIVNAFWQALKGMGYIALLMLVGLLMYAIFATIAIGQNDVFKNVRIREDSVKDRFGTVPKSMYSLFELMTLEGWNDTARPLVMASPGIFLFLASFIAIFTFGLLNMTTALVVGKTLEESRNLESREETAARIKLFEEMTLLREKLIEYDKDHDGYLSLNEFDNFLKSSRAARETLERMGVPIQDVKELYQVMDVHGTGQLSIPDFLEGCAKVRGALDTSWDVTATHAGVKGLLRYANQLGADLSALDARQARFREQVYNRMSNQQEKLESVLHKLRTQRVYVGG